MDSVGMQELSFLELTKMNVLTEVPGDPTEGTGLSGLVTWGCFFSCLPLSHIVLLSLDQGSQFLSRV